jgi:hypothetical protein
MDGPKRKPVSYFKPGVLKIDQVEPSVPKSARMWFDLPKDECVK